MPTFLTSLRDKSTIVFEFVQAMPLKWAVTLWFHGFRVSGVKCSAMGIRLKILLAFILCFGVMAGIGLDFLQRSVDQSYGAIERDEIEANMGRVEQSFEASAVSLKNQTRDWAVWNEMYRYALNPDPNWVVENIGDDALAPADISMVMIFDLDGRLLNFSAAKENGVDLKVLTSQITPYLTRIRSDARETQCGILQIDAGLMIACWSGILPSDSSGSPVGTVLMGRLLNPVRLAAMRAQIKLPFELSTQTQMPDDLQAWPKPLAPGLIGSGQFRTSSTPDVYHLLYPVQDILKQDVGLISLDMPRSVHQQSLLLYQQVRRQLGWTALSVTVLLSLALHFILIRRLRRFARQIDILEEHSTWKTRIDIGGNDELGLVAKNFNELLGLVRSQVDGLRDLVDAKEGAIKLIQATQKQLVESERLAQLRQQRVSNLLDSSGQGFLSFGRDLMIDPEVSRACQIMLGCSPAGREAARVLFGEDQARVELFREIVPAAHAEPDPDIRESMLSLLPTEIRRGERLLHAEYKVLEDHRFMVVLTDITEERRLEDMLQSERCRLELIVMAVSDTRNFFASIDAFREFANHGLPHVLDVDVKSDILAKTLYREIHTYKGVLSQFGFIHAPRMLHDIETQLTGSDRLTREDIGRIVSPSILMAQFDEDLAILTDALGAEFVKHGERFVLSGEQAEQLEKLAVDLLQGKAVDAASSDVQRVLDEIVTLRKVTFADVLTGFDGLLARAARRVEKNVAPIEVTGGEDIWIDPLPYKAFFRALGHVFRNAVVHGIESPDGRWSAGKTAVGRVTCRVKRVRNRIHLSISDDGAGLDLEALRQRAVAAGIGRDDEVGRMSEDDIARLIFRDGLSVRDTVSTLSGRGVGLAAVLDETHKLGGEVTVTTAPGKGAEFLFDLPSKHCAANEVLFACRHPLSQDAGRVMQSIMGKSRAYFKSEYQIEVSELCSGGGSLESLNLLGMTAVISMGGGVRLCVAFSLEEGLVDAIYERMTAGFNDRPEEVDKHREAAIGELLNTVLGHCTIDLQHRYGEVISMTPPTILGPEQAISSENGTMFYTRGMETALGRMAISLVGPREIFATNPDQEK